MRKLSGPESRVISGGSTVCYDSSVLTYNDYRLFRNIAIRDAAFSAAIYGLFAGLMASTVVSLVGLNSIATTVGVGVGTLSVPFGFKAGYESSDIWPPNITW